MDRILRLCLVVCIIVKNQVAVAQIPVITTNPKDTIVCIGSDVALSVVATNNPTGYVWQYNPDPSGNTWNTILTNDTEYGGATTNQLIVHTNALSIWLVGSVLRFRCIAVNANGSSLPSSTAVLKIAQPNPGFNIYGNQNLCKESSDYFTTNMNLNIDSVTWSFSGTGLTINTSHSNNNTSQDSAILISITDSTTEGILTATDSNACGVYGPATYPITISPEQRNIAGIAGLQVCASSFGPTMDGSGCAPIFYYSPSGANPVNVYLSACVTLDSAVQSYGGVPYVQRHYNIEPTGGDPSTSTATLTLLYTQADFDAYNLARGTNPALPTGPADATGIANLRVTQFHGSGTTPGTYTGTTGEIDPPDNNIVWNSTANRWEVTFSITGFSGFFLSTGSLIPLPLTLTAFIGQSTEKGNLLQWTTAEEQNTAYFEIQSSTGAAFTSVARVAAAGNSQLPLHYSYIDPVSAGSSISYRLKMVDLDGSASYSRIIALGAPGAFSYSIKASPSNYIVTAPTPGSAILLVSDISGRQLYQQNVVLSKGINTFPANSLPAGSYLLTLLADKQRFTTKFVRY
jgi:hypothetical protein